MAVGLHMQVVYERTRGSGTEDVAVTTHDFFAPDAGDFSQAWMDDIFAAWQTFWVNGIGTFISSATKVRELRFWDDYNGDGSPGSVDYVRAMNIAGQASGAMLPPQVACSVTELLGPESRRHWGRFYVPGMAINCLAPTGEWVGSFVTAIANAANVLYDAWKTPDYYPVVWFRTVAFPANAIPVVEIRVDNIPDVIRRRRYQSITQRVTHTVE